MNSAVAQFNACLTQVSRQHPYHIPVHAINRLKPRFSRGVFQIIWHGLNFIAEHLFQMLTPFTRWIVKHRIDAERHTLNFPGAFVGVAVLADFRRFANFQRGRMR